MSDISVPPHHQRQLLDIQGKQNGKLTITSMWSSLKSKEVLPKTIQKGMKHYAPEGISKIYLTNTRLVGLQNVGNFCYINTLFRLLSVSFLPYIFNDSSAKLKEILTSGSALMPLTRILYYEWRLDLVPRVVPLKLNKLVNYVQNQMGLGVGQHDLSELFNLLLPTIVRECESVCDIDVMSFTRRKRIICCSNKHPEYVVPGVHETYLPVAIPLSGKVNLEDTIKGEEHMELNPLHICNVCAHVGTRSVLEFQSTCKFLNILIRRIDYKSNNQARKLKTQVEFTRSLNIIMNSMEDQEEDKRGTDDRFLRASSFSDGVNEQPGLGTPRAIGH